MNKLTGAALTTIGLLGVACASAPQPTNTERIASAQAAIRAAREVGAGHLPQAQLHAQLAKEQVAQALKLIEDNQNERAALLLDRAKADAELAVALARENEARQQAEQAEKTLSTRTVPPPSTMQATVK